MEIPLAVGLVHLAQADLVSLAQLAERTCGCRRPQLRLWAEERHSRPGRRAGRTCDLGLGNVFYLLLCFLYYFYDLPLILLLFHVQF